MTLDSSESTARCPTLEELAKLQPHISEAVQKALELNIQDLSSSVHLSVKIAIIGKNTQVSVFVRHEEAEDVPESVTCMTCDAQADSIAEATAEGWTDIERHDGLSWNYLGTCPDCVRAEYEERERLQCNDPASQKELF